ncbi:MAG: D-alanyl-D-alanine carboxypeptidase family protein [Verrucomicrobiota bacterium]
MFTVPFRALLTSCATLFACLAATAVASAQEGIWKGYIAIDAATGETLLEDNPDVVAPPASMTKLMTFAVVSDQIKAGAIALDTVVQITREDAAMGGTQVFLDPRESFTVEELIHALMIQSANDAAHALARASAGSVDTFVDLMNAKARALGMTNTIFRTPHGLPPSSRKEADGDLTTPRDFAKLSRHLVQSTDVIQYASVRRRVFGPLRKEPMQMINHNKLLVSTEGVDGLKTGYTKGAGYCLSATALRGGKRVVVVIMGAFGPGGQVDLGRSRDRKAADILNRAFAALPAGSPKFVGAHDPGAPAALTPQPVAPGGALIPQPVEPAKHEEPTVKFVFPPK